MTTAKWCHLNGGHSFHEWGGAGALYDCYGQPAAEDAEPDEDEVLRLTADVERLEKAARQNSEMGKAAEAWTRSDYDKLKAERDEAVAALVGAADMIASLNATSHAGARHRGEVADCDYAPCCTWRRVYEGMRSSQPRARHD